MSEPMSEPAKNHHPISLDVRDDGIWMRFATTEEAKVNFEDGVLKGFYLQMPDPFTVIIQIGNLRKDRTPRTWPHKDA